MLFPFVLLALAAIVLAAGGLPSKVSMIALGLAIAALVLAVFPGA